MVIVEILITRDGDLEYLYYEPELLSGLNSDSKMMGFRVLRIMRLVTDGIN